MNTIGDNIKNARKALQMSQDTLAELIGANRVTISRYEAGHYLPSVPALERIATALQTTTAKLTGSEQDGDKWQIAERLRNDPNYRLLFDAAETASPEHIRAAAAMLKALEGKTDD